MIRFVRFSVVGFINTLVSTVTYWIALKVGISPSISYFVSFLLGAINSIWLNTQWTFRIPRQSYKMWIRGFALNTGIALMTSFAISTIIQMGIPVQGAQLALVPVTLSINYGFGKLWVFAQQG